MTLEELLMGMQPRFGTAPNVLFPPPGPQTGQMMRPGPMPMPPMEPVPPVSPTPNSLEEFLALQRQQTMPPRMPSVAGQIQGLMPEEMGPHIAPSPGPPLPTPGPLPQLPVTQPGAVPKLPSFIQLGPQPRPPQEPMLGGVDIPGAIGGFLSNMTAGDAAAVPGAVPPAVPPGQTPVGSGLWERPGPAIQNPLPAVREFLSSIPPAVEKMFPPANPTVPAQGMRTDVPLPARVGPGQTSSGQGAPAGGSPAAPPPRWGLPAPSTPGAGTTTRTMTLGGPSQGAGPSGGMDPKALAMNTIRGFEDFRERPYWDVNALRTGYGSDTVTLADGTVKKVTEGMKVTKEDAERDLERRTNEFMGTVKGQIGEATFAGLTPNQQAALTSIAYNYGKLPDRVVDVIKKGGNVAVAIQGLGSDNDGINANRRRAEANMWDGGGTPGGGNPMPGVPDYQRTVLPIPQPVTPQKGLPPNAFDQFNQLGVTRPPPRNPVDNIVAILGAMSGAAAGAKNAGDLLAAAGGAAGGQAAKNVSLSREEGKEFSQREDALKRFMAEIGVRKAEAETQGENLKIQAENENKRLTNLVATEQAKLDSALQNRLAEEKNKIDWKRWERFEEQIIPSKDGISIVKRNPDGSINYTTTRGADMDAQADAIKKAGEIYGKDSEAVEALRYQALRQGAGGESRVRRQALRDLVEGNHAATVLGEQYKALEKEATKGLDPALQGRPEYDKQKKEKMLDLLWTMMQGATPEEQQKKDNIWLPFLLRQGNIGARMLAEGGRGG